MQNDLTAPGSGIQAKAGRREWIGLGVIALPCMLYSMDLTVLNLALPFISADLQPSSSELLWIVDIYGFMVAGFLITMGNLGDRFGRRKMLLIGAGAFGIASVFAAYSNSAVMLIANRAVLGIAGATLAPSTLSLIRNMFHDPKQRTFAIGIWITSYSVGGAMGPLIGGFVLQQFWWGAVFLIAVPVMILLLVLGPLLLPEYKDADAGRMDFLSALLSLVAVLSVIFGLKQIAEKGMNWLSVSSILAGIIIGYMFLRRQKKLPYPLIDLRLFHKATFSLSLLMYTLATFVIFGAFIFTFQYMQLIGGLSPINAGLWSLPFFLAFVIGSLIAPVLVRKFQVAHIMATGLFMAALGFGICTQVHNEQGLIYLVAGGFLYSLGIAPVFTLTTDIIVGAAPADKAGSASAISETGSELGGALGIAILGSIGTAIYRTQIALNTPKEVAPNIIETAKETLAAAHAEAQMVPAALNSLFINSVHGAFISGMQVVALICMTLMVLLAILSLKKLSVPIKYHN
ncbi:MAG TPA: MFS transporter [Chitinophagaceae bacterium]|nr:MFS transporter [Chitinophagaceae bacterium]